MSDKTSFSRFPWFQALVLFLLLVLSSLAGAQQVENPDAGSAGRNRGQETAAPVGDPISAANGAFQMDLPFLNLGGPWGLSFSVMASQNITAFGVSTGLVYENFWWTPFVMANLWAENYEDTYDVYLENGNSVSFKKRDGVYVLNEDGGEYPANGQPTRYVMKEGANHTYMMDPNRGRVYVIENQTQLGGQYNRVRYVLDRNGNRLRYDYYDAMEPPYLPDSLVRAIGDELGRWLNFEYQDIGGHIVLSRVTDDAGRSIVFVWGDAAADNCDRIALRSITDALGGRYAFAYQCVYYGGLQALAGNIASVQYPRGNIPYTQHYVCTDTAIPGYLAPFTGVRVDRQTDAYGHQMDLAYAPTAYQTTVTYPDGATENYSHDSPYSPPRGVTDGEGKTTTTSVNAHNQMTSLTDRHGSTVTATYHEDSGRLASQTDQTGANTRYFYTPQNQTFTNPIDNEGVTFTFHELTRVEYADGTIETFTYDPRGNIISRTDRGGKTWEYTYSARGQMLTTRNPRGSVTTTTYNADGTRASFQQGALGTVTYTYDAYRRPARITQPDGSYREMTYDLNDRPLTLRDERGGLTTLRYDANGNLIERKDPLGGVNTFTYDLMDRVTEAADRRGKITRNAYDARSRLASVTDPSGIVTAMTYDDRGLRISTTVDGRTNATAYDAEGAESRLITPMGLTSSFTRDSFGRIVETIGPTGARARYDLDPMGRTKKTTDSLDREKSFAYDALGRMTGQTLPGGLSTAYAYDDLGNLQTLCDFNGKEWTFARTADSLLTRKTDPLGRVTTLTYDTRGRQTGGTLPDGVTFIHTLDAVGNILQKAYATGPTIAFAYDASNALIQTDGVEFTRDPEGLITRSNQGERLFEAEYDDDGRIARLVYDNGALTVSYTYDGRGLVSRVADSGGTHIDFTYNDDANLTGILRRNGVNLILTYDDKGRLVRQAEGGIMESQNTYDALDRIAGMTFTAPLDPAQYLEPGVQTLTFDDASQVNSVGHTYDALGRQTAMPGHTLAWDAAGRLTGLDGAVFAYNGLNQITACSAGGVVERYFYHHALPGMPLAAEADGAGVIQRFYVYDPLGNLLYMVDAANGDAVSYYHFDRTGSTAALTDDAGNVTDAYAYDPYGRLLHHQGSKPQPFTFLGRAGVRQASTDGAIYNVRARYYWASGGRFLSRDENWPALDSPLSGINPYVYAAADPANLADIDGHEVQGLHTGCFIGGFEIISFDRPVYGAPYGGVIETRYSAAVREALFKFDVISGRGAHALDIRYSMNRPGLVAIGSEFNEEFHQTYWKDEFNIKHLREKIEEIEEIIEYADGSDQSVNAKFWRKNLARSDRLRDHLEHSAWLFKKEAQEIEKELDFRRTLDRILMPYKPLLRKIEEVRQNEEEQRGLKLWQKGLVIPGFEQVRGVYKGEDGQLQGYVW